MAHMTLAQIEALTTAPLPTLSEPEDGLDLLATPFKGLSVTRTGEFYISRDRRLWPVGRTDEPLVGVIPSHMFAGGVRGRASWEGQTLEGWTTTSYLPHTAAIEWRRQFVCRLFAVGECSVTNAYDLCKDLAPAHKFLLGE